MHKYLHNNKVAKLVSKHKILAVSSGLAIIVAVFGTLFFTGTITNAPLFNAEQSPEPVQQQALIDNVELLDDIGLTKEAISESPSIKVTPGRCKGSSAYHYDPSGTLSVTSKVRDGSYVCTTYEVDTVKSYILDDGSKVTEETHANAETGTRQTVKTTEKPDGNTEVNIGYEAIDGSGMGWGGSGEERCFGPNNTVCTMVDTGVQSFVEMLQSCILVSTGDSYWRLGTAADNLAANDTGTYMGSCSQWQSYKNLFYDK